MSATRRYRKFRLNSRQQDFVKSSFGSGKLVSSLEAGRNDDMQQFTLRSLQSLQKQGEYDPEVRKSFEHAAHPIRSRCATFCAARTVNVCGNKRMSVTW